QLPAAQNHRLRPFEVLAERYLPDIADYQTMPNVEDAAGALRCASMAWVLARAGPAIGALGGIVNHVGPGIARRYAQPAVEAVLVAGLQGLERAIAVGDHKPD